MQENCPGSKVNEASRSEDPTQVCFSETQMLDVSAGRSSTSVPSCSSRWNREAQSGEAMELGLRLQVPLRSWLCPVLLSAFYLPMLLAAVLRPFLLAQLSGGELYYSIAHEGLSRFKSGVRYRR